MPKLNGLALAAIGAGSLFVWSGIKGWSVTATLGDVITGKRPRQSSIYALSTPEGQSSGIGGATGSAISDAAVQYQGHAYLYGGAPGKDAQNPWDCSSFCNWIIGHKLGGTIPGYGPGKYDGSIHGPPTGSWAIWPGLHRISRSELQAGDLIVWSGHMGIAVSNDHMVSALNPIARTKITPIDGYGNGALLKYGRL
jgi:cell wall-associated NlpC family hydrolase